MNDKPAMANTQAFAVITQDELSSLRAELAELRARAGELERQVRDKHEAATVDEICNAYESGVGHRGRPTASVNPYRQGSDLATAYNIGALGDRESPAEVPDDVEKDAERLDWLVSEVALVQSLAISPPHGDGTTRYYIVWPEYGEEQRDTYATPREAIDAAILAAKEKGQ